MADISDGAIVGSAIVKLVAKYGKTAVGPVRDYVLSMVEAVRGVRGMEGGKPPPSFWI